ncbi:unnamed protein product [Pylaiella littoralis]
MEDDTLSQQQRHQPSSLDSTSSSSPPEAAAAAEADSLREEVEAPAPRTISLKKSCDFCVRRKRYCDGFGQKRCSFCIKKARPECHFSIRTPVVPFRASTKKSPGTTGDSTTRNFPPLTGVSFWGRNEEENNDSEVEGGGRRVTTSTDSTMRNNSSLVPLPPLKRGRFSASPATGLIGTPENELLGDFFECLGFLSLATGSVVRDAMVTIMQASAPEETNAVPSTVLAHGGGASTYGSLTIEENTSNYIVGSGDGGGGNQTGQCWTSAMTAGGATLPRNASTCILWCAVALGALVRGRTFSYVQRYVGLAQDSLAACTNKTTRDARAYLVMAFLLNFLGNQPKNHRYVELASEIVNALPPEEVPTGIHQVLGYAGKAWVFERELASPEEIDGYWESTTPIWQLSDTVVEQDICAFVLSVDVHVDQIVLEERYAQEGSLAKLQQQSQWINEKTMPEMLRLDGCLEMTARFDDSVHPVRVALTSPPTPPRSSLALPHFRPRWRNVGEKSSKMHSGLGSLLYYGNLAYLQLVNNDTAASAVSFQRSVAAMLRFPGLCRYNSLSHTAHVQLWGLAVRGHREKYEELRAAYNPVRSAISPPAPPFEEWRGVADICNHAYCRHASEQMAFLVRPKKA